MPHHTRRRHRGKFKLILGLSFILVLGTGIYSYSRYQYLLHTPPAEGSAVAEYKFRVSKGDNSRKIAEKLAKDDLILDKFTFEIATRLNNIDKNLKAGVYQLNTGMSANEIIQTLQEAQPSQVVVTIPEGYTVLEIDQLLASQNLIQSGEFSAAVQKYPVAKYPFLDANQISKLPHALEGYLFPDTYFVDPNNFQSATLITLMLNNFRDKVLPLYENSSKKYTLSEVVNVAAMVEEETNQDVDRPLVADIIWRRLEAQWTLGIDATLLYLKADREIDAQDLAENSPYNTRKVAGLPPGPIANPGLKSLAAAINPEANPYFFYLTSRDGETKYAITNEEHNNNKRKYL